MIRERAEASSKGREHHHAGLDQGGNGADNGLGIVVVGDVEAVEPGDQLGFAPAHEPRRRRGTSLHIDIGQAVPALGELWQPPHIGIRAQRPHGHEPGPGGDDGRVVLGDFGMPSRRHQRRVAVVQPADHPAVGGRPLGHPLLGDGAQNVAGLSDCWQALRPTLGDSKVAVTRIGGPPEVRMATEAADLAGHDAAKAPGPILRPEQDLDVVRPGARQHLKIGELSAEV